MGSQVGKLDIFVVIFSLKNVQCCAFEWEECLIALCTQWYDEKGLSRAKMFEKSFKAAFKVTMIYD